MVNILWIMMSTLWWALYDDHHSMEMQGVQELQELQELTTSRWVFVRTEMATSSWTFMLCHDLMHFMKCVCSQFKTTGKVRVYSVLLMFGIWKMAWWLLYDGAYSCDDTLWMDVSCKPDVFSRLWYHFAHYIYCILVAISLWICWCLFASYCTSVDRLPWCCIHAAWMRNTRQKTVEKCPRSFKNEKPLN